MKIVIPILKNCLDICERFKSRILCFELNAVEKYNVLERVFEAVRDESFFHLGVNQDRTCALSNIGPFIINRKRNSSSVRVTARTGYIVTSFYSVSIFVRATGYFVNTYNVPCYPR